MTDPEIRSLDYLRELSRLTDDWENDPACMCCDWAVGEIERLRNAVAYLREKAVQTHGTNPYFYVWQWAWDEFERRVDE